MKPRHPHQSLFYCNGPRWRLLSCVAIMLGCHFLLVISYSKTTSDVTTTDHEALLKENRDKIAADATKIPIWDNPLLQQRAQAAKLLLQEPLAYRPFPFVGRFNATASSWCVSGGVDYHVPSSSSSSATALTPPIQGLLLAKTMKTASSTAAAVTMRLARRVAQRASSSPHEKTCRHMFVHGQSFANAFENRDLQRSFLWTVVRRPDRRAISAYKYFELGMMGQEPSLYAFVTYLEATKDQMLQQLRMDRPRINQVLGILTVKNKTRTVPQNNNIYNKKKGPYPNRRQVLGPVAQEDRLNANNVATLIRDTVQRYNFVAVSERMDESLIVLLYLLGLLDPNDDNDGNSDNFNNQLLTDVVVLASKQAGGWEENIMAGQPQLHEAIQYQGLPPALTQNIPIRNEKCIVIPNKVPFLPLTTLQPTSKNDKIAQMTQTYLEHNFTVDNLDFLLYDYANRNLDHTIATVIGYTKVQTWVKQLRQLQTQAQERCQSKAVFPCSSTGQYQSRARYDCYAADMGCGYQCIDELYPVKERE